MYGADDAIDLGHGIAIVWDSDGHGILWHHPNRPGHRCAWAFARFLPDPLSRGHRIVSGGPNDIAHFTVEGSLLCPECGGHHGWIRDGRWIPA
jgi:hypothetical protein